MQTKETVSQKNPERERDLGREEGRVCGTLKGSIELSLKS